MTIYICFPFSDFVLLYLFSVFQVSEKLDRSDNKVSGKRKRGGQWVDETSILCKITCHDDDTTYSIHCGVRGTLVEMNENLITNPELMTSLTQPEHGWVQ